MTTLSVSPLERYLFDLQGFLHLENALSAEEVAALNRRLDAIPVMEKGAWHGAVHAHSFGGKDGTNLQQIYEGGPEFEALIDHPSWIGRIKHFVGDQPGNFDLLHGPVFIDEAFANLRGPGEAIGLHSGGHKPVKRTQYRFHNGEFACSQVNILMALTDIGPGDGATMLIPGSHKANLEHPQLRDHQIRPGEMTSVDGVTGAREVHMKAGDALLFVDGIMHGSAQRTNPGQRRIIVYRYGPSWGFFRHPYRPSRELLARLTPERRAIVWPHEHKLFPPGTQPEGPVQAGNPA